MISTSTGTGKKSGVGSGKETLRLRSKGPATVQVVSKSHLIDDCKATIFYLLDYISLSGISKCGDEKKCNLSPKYTKLS